MGRVQTLPYHKTLCGGCVPQLPLLINAQMGRWTEGAKIVRDKAVLSRPQTPPRNAGRGCGFERFQPLFRIFLAPGPVLSLFWRCNQICYHLTEKCRGFNGSHSFKCAITTILLELEVFEWQMTSGNSLMRIDPDTDRKVKTAIPLANCRSQNEVRGEGSAVQYCDYVSIPGLLLRSAAHAGGCNTATVQNSEEPHLSSAVQAGRGDGHDDERPGRGHEIPEEQLRELRGRCVQEVKTPGLQISLDDAVEYQNGGGRGVDGRRSPLESS